MIDNSMFPSGTRNYSGFSRNLQKNADGSYTITWHFVLDEKLATKILYPAWRYDNIRIDGYPCYVIEDYMFSIWMDHTAPAVTNIVQTDQTSHDSWATAKRLDISGTEDCADIVVLSIIDKTTQHVVVNDAKIGVTDKKWSYTCTPDLEGGESGRTYTIRTKDVNGNISNTDFTVYNTDSASPQIESPLSYTDWTNTAKTITLTFTDYGSGDVQASLDNQTSYKACTKTADGKYQITYTFSDDIIGNKTYKLYLRDGLGNADSYDLIVGNIDKNTYNISYNLNGGSLSGQKTSYTVADSFTLPQPTRIGYTFTGWTGTGLSGLTKTVTVAKGSTGNRSYTANWSANSCFITFDGNGGSLYVSDPTIVKNDNGTATAKTWYDTNYYYILGIIPTRQGYTFKGFYDAPSGGTQVFKPYNPANCISVPSKYYNENNIWKYAGNVTFYAQWEPITWTTKYDANGGSGIMADTIHRFNCGDKIRHNQFIRPGWTMTGWTVSRVRDGVTEWHYGTSDGHWINGYSWYELGQNPPGTSLWVEHKLDTVDNSSTYIDGDIHTMHAQWQYNPVSVKVPQILTGDHTGTSQFRVKCDDLKAGNIKVAVPNSFLYKQAGKADVTAAITAKSGNNIITPSNKVCVYNITTRNGLSAGCWQGSFNIGLTLTKE